MAIELAERLSEAVQASPTRASEPTPTPDSETPATATCFAVAPDGWLITANHVVEGRNSVEIHIDGVIATAEVLVRDPDHDVAVLRTGVLTPKYLSLDGGYSLQLGQRVYALGYPLTEILTKDVRFTDGTISSLSAIEGAEGFFQVSVPVQPGNSGGPLLSEDGEVIGLVVGRAQWDKVLKETGSLPENISFVVDGKYLLSILQRANAKLPETRGLTVNAAAEAVHFIEVR